MPHVDVKTGFRGGVDANELPVGIMWEVRRTFTDDEGNALGETRTTVPWTPEEIATHISAGLTARDADIAADRDLIVSLRADLAAMTAERDALASQIPAPAE